MANITCPSCRAVYELDADLLSQNLDAQGERHMRCSQCQHAFTYKPLLAAPLRASESDSLDIQKSQTTETTEQRFGIPSGLEISTDKPKELVDLEQVPPPEPAASETLVKDPVLGEPAKPKRLVGFQSETTTTPSTQAEAPRKRVLDDVRTQVKGPRRSSEVLLPLLLILGFLALTWLAAWWIWENKRDWFNVSYWTGQQIEGQASTKDEIQQEIIESEIMALPLARPEIKGQKVEAKTLDDSVELYLAGVLQNRTGNPIRLERMRVVAINDDQQVSKSWFFSPGARTLANTEVLPFSNKTSWPKGERWTVKFGWEGVIAKLPEVAAYDAGN